MDYFSGLKFVCFGDKRGTHEYCKKKTFAGYYGIQYTHTGKLSISVNQEPPGIFDAPCVFVSSPGPVFSYGSLSGEVRDHSFVCFSGKRTEEYLKRGLLRPTLQTSVIPIRQAERFYSTLRELQTLLAYPGGGEQPRAVLMLEDLLLQIHEQDVPNGVNAFCEQRIRRLRDDIVNDPLREWNFVTEAEDMALSYSHFRRLFNIITGYAPNQFLIECRLNFAGDMLINSTAPTAAIARASGFSDVYYFSRLFKHHRHITPSAYRRTFRQ